jgi:tRNA dimethylallyltransferase
VLALLGPTASGKSAAAMALAERFPLEIISVDSAQVYRELNIGTAKASSEERALVPHHLIDIVDPTQSYSAARFAADAQRLIGEIKARGRVPLLVGGTMLYYKALREGLSALPEADADVRAAIEQEAAAIGWPALHAELAGVDPVSAARLQPTDAQRIQRALEVYRITGSPLSALLGTGTAPLAAQRWLSIALVPRERAPLHARIAARFAGMLERGLVQELAGLRRRHALQPQMPSMRTVGYRQAWEFLEGRISMQQLREQGVFATRQLAKRQLTWLRGTAALTPIDALDPHAAARVVDAVGQFLGAG